jgi:hypothetical protein
MQSIPQPTFLLEQHYALGPEELSLLQRAFDRACEVFGLDSDSPEKLRTLAKAIVEAYEPNTDEASLIVDAFALIGASVLKIDAATN